MHPSLCHRGVNAGLGNEITFDIPGDTVPVIILIKALPTLTEPVTIDGTTQSAGKVEVRGGAFAGAGFYLQGGASEVRGMVLNGFNGRESAAIRISGPGENRIVGNWLGTDASGNQVRKTQFGVLIEGSPDNTISGEGADEGNILYGETSGIEIRQAGANNTRILGNRIGIGANDAIFTPLIGAGISQSDGSGTVIGNAANGKNLIAGGAGIALSADSTMDDIRIVGNHIGLDGTGTIASNGFTGILVSAGELVEVKKVTIEGNKIAGHSMNVLALDGGGVGELLIKNNDIGLAFTGSGNAPGGMTDGTQGYGLRLDGPIVLEASNNVVAGHNYNLLLSGIPQIYVFGGEDTDGDGKPDSNFSVSIINPDKSDLPDIGDPVAENAKIKNNFVGVDRFGRLPAGSPDQLVGIANYGGAKGTEIDGNTIGGQSQFGLWLESGLKLKAGLNRIGVSLSGLPVPNGAGIKIDTAEVELTNNTVAQNTNIGVLIEGDDNLVSIRGGSFYKNGNGAGTVGILFDSPVVQPVDDLFVFRSNIDGNGMVDVTFALPAIGGIADPASGEAEPETTLEIWGNPDSAQTQGRTLLVSERIDPEKDFSHKVTVKPESVFVSSQNFTATLTRGPVTSGFSPAVLPEALKWPELEYSPTDGSGGITIKDNEIAFEWAVVKDADLFILEEAPSFAGPWIPLEQFTSVSNGKAQATVSMGDHDERFFRLRINPAALGNSTQQRFSLPPVQLDFLPLAPVR